MDKVFLAVLVCLVFSLTVPSIASADTNETVCVCDVTVPETVCSFSWTDLDEYCEDVYSLLYVNVTPDEIQEWKTSVSTMEIELEHMSSDLSTCREERNLCNNKYSSSRDTFTGISVANAECKAELEAKTSELKTARVCPDCSWTSHSYLILVGFFIAFVDSQWTRWILNRRKRPEEVEIEDGEELGA